MLAFPCLEATMAIYFKQVLGTGGVLLNISYFIHLTTVQMAVKATNTNHFNLQETKNQWFGEVKQKLHVAGLKKCIAYPGIHGVVFGGSSQLVSVSPLSKVDLVINGGSNLLTKPRILCGPIPQVDHGFLTAENPAPYPRF